MRKFLFVTVCCITGVLYGQGPPGPPAHFGMGPHEMGMGMHGKVVANAPYTADVTDTMSQRLADGNTIERTTTGKVARDSKGRTYLQETITEGPLAVNGATTLTFITDPVAGYTYVVNTASKTVIRRPFHAPPTNAGAPPKPPGEASNRVEADLGTMTVAGVSAKGQSITRTIPAGAIGNANPIVSTSEVWRSPTLQIVVKATHTDPRTGNSTYQLSNIKPGEPNSALFQVPSDYTVRDAQSWGPRGTHAPPPPPPPEQ
jgi:hypothetical protein